MKPGLRTARWIFLAVCRQVEAENAIECACHFIDFKFQHESSRLWSDAYSGVGLREFEERRSGLMTFCVLVGETDFTKAESISRNPCKELTCYRAQSGKVTENSQRL